MFIFNIFFFGMPCGMSRCPNQDQHFQGLGHQEKLCEVYLAESMDIEVLRVFVDLPIVQSGTSHMALNQFCA